MGYGPQKEQIFAKPTVSEWVAKINKDLKGAKTAEDLKYAIEDGLSVSAVQSYAAQDLKPISRDRDNDHMVAVHVDTRESNSNATVKDLLNIGVNTLILDAYSDVDYSGVLKDVILDYIRLVIFPMDEGADDEVLSYLKDQGVDMKKVYSPSSQRNLIHIPFTGSISDQLTLLLNKINASKGDDLLLIMDSQKDFLSEVSKIRAAHILIGNISKALGKEINYKLLAHTKASNEGVHELIQSSYMGLAAIIGEADGIVSVALDPKFRLNAVHTYNLLTMESYLGKVSDPAAGSNLIEKMTEVICQKSWDSFVEKI